ncbi:MAG: ubiquinol oxidase subunit II [Oligoflexia bacterium]|nr:ubiquinol oxidase subunit II [Oligoflexia bacterium]
MKNLKSMKKIFLSNIVLFSFLFLSSCKLAVFDPRGIIASQQRDLILTSLWLMLVVVIPVLVMTFVFSYKYRASNTKAKYDPNFEHNNVLEVIWWTVPIIIIAILATITWKTSHSLDPYRPLESKVRPIEVQVVALNWKWLFIYPEQGIASVNFLQFPVNVPVNLKITAEAPMNSFWIPKLAGQIYAMEGMQTLLHIMADTPGSYDGLSSNFSGEGFNGMKFIAKASSPLEFNEWVAEAKRSLQSLSQERYGELVRPSSYDKVQYFSSVEEGLFVGIMMRFMMPVGTGESCHQPHSLSPSQSESELDSH